MLPVSSNSTFDSIKHRRGAIVRSLFLLALSLVIIRLFHIQVLNSNKYKASARDQQQKVDTIEAKRGSILTSDGFPVVNTETLYQVWVDNKNYKDFEKIKLDRDIWLSANKIDQATAQKKTIYLGDVNITSKELLSNYRYLFFQPYTKRTYPEGNLLGHVLGVVRKDDEGKSLGYYGLEQYYNGDLTGQDGAEIVFKSADGKPIVQAGFDKIYAKDGSTLTLTINREIQYLTEYKLAEGVKKYNAKSGTIIIVNPETGEIIAMANQPDFDPNNFKDKEALRNNAIASIYEPGSVMKPMTMAAALDLGLITPETTYNDTGARMFSGHKVDNWDGKHHGVETMISILQHSNNLGTAWVGQKVGAKSLMHYFDSFGFGKESTIDLEGEESGIIYQSDNLKDIELVNSAFGQGIAVTPLQMVMAYSTIANDGKLMRPYVVSKIEGNGIVTLNSPKILNKPISQKTARTLVSMLREAVAGGEAKYFVSKKYNISGKTGTAQIAFKGGYDENRTNATFVGFFTESKKFVMLVKLEEPTFPSGYAAETAVPLWMDLADNLATYYNLTPDKVL